MVLQFLLQYKNLVLQITLTLSVSLILTFLKLPILFLQGLFTYIHPENLAQNNNGVRAAIRRPDSSNSSSGLDGYQNLSSKRNPEVKKRNRSKEKFEFDENNAQIFRLKLDENHLCTRLYFTAYRDVFNYFVLAMPCLLLYMYINVSNDSGVFVSGAVVAAVLSFLGVCKAIVSIARVSFEKSASRRSEKQLSLFVGILGFVLGFMICFGIVSYVFDFELGSVDGFGRVCIAALMGVLAGFMFMPAVKITRSFWIGTDQLRWNLGIISCGWIAKMLLYVNYLFMVFTSLLWIDPFAKLLVKKNIGGSKEAYLINGSANAEQLVGNVGMPQSDFTKFRILCLLLSGVMQIVVVRPNLQMYLNEAVLAWYQRLHSSKVPDLDFSRAKVFLHNHYLCLAVLQYFAPPVLVLLFLGLSQIDGKSFENFPLVYSLVTSSFFVKEVALLLAWWIVFVSTTFTSAHLMLYRRGILYVS